MFSWLLKEVPKTPQPSRVPDGSRAYVIGDVHGRSDLLDELRSRVSDHLAANPCEDAILVMVGDYVDRGPDSSGVLERLCAPPPTGMRQVLLKGNHEDMLLKFLEAPGRGNEWRTYGGGETLKSYGVTLGADMPSRILYELAKELRSKIPLEHLKLLTLLQPSFEIGDYFICHAGIRPGTPLDLQGENDLLWIRETFLKSEKDHGKIIVHGHTPVDEPQFHANRIAIDTGAHQTGRLTCLVLEGPDRDIIATA